MREFRGGGGGDECECCGDDGSDVNGSDGECGCVWG